VSKLVVVTATTNPERAEHCVRSWGAVQKIVIENGLGKTTPYLGTVPAFRKGVDYALAQTDAEIIACLHDDVELLDPDWMEKVLMHFERTPACGLLGFGGAIGLGSERIYKDPYDPMQLARIGFRSNMIDAESHGIRSLLAERVACLDGFSQVGRRSFWEGWGYNRFQRTGEADETYRPWTVLEELGLVHHIYDGALGAIASRYGWETWYLPIRCRHLGGQTAVGDRGYQAWAETQVANGDQGFWQEGHRIVYDAFRDILPLRV